MLYFLYALSCMFACNSIAIVYMLFVLGVLSKILIVQMFTKVNCMVIPLSFVGHVLCKKHLCNISL